MTERFGRTDFGHLEIAVTFDESQGLQQDLDIPTQRAVGCRHGNDGSRLQFFRSRRPSFPAPDCPTSSSGTTMASRPTSLRVIYLVTTSSNARSELGNCVENGGRAVQAVRDLMPRRT